MKLYITIDRHKLKKKKEEYTNHEKVPIICIFMNELSRASKIIFFYSKIRQKVKCQNQKCKKKAFYNTWMFEF